MVPKLVQACSNLRMPIYVLLELEQACTNSKKGHIGVIKNRTGLFYFLEGDVFETLYPFVLQFINKKESRHMVRLFFCIQFLYTIIL